MLLGALGFSLDITEANSDKHDDSNGTLQGRTIMMGAANNSAILFSWKAD